MAIAPQQGAAATAGGPGVSSGTRYTIVGLLSASIAINLIDRQVLSVLVGEPVRRRHGLDDSRLSSGWDLGDRVSSEGSVDD